jgi:hypothetical protein
MAFDIIAAANDIWFRSDTCLRPLYHFDTAEASTTCSGIAISPTGRCIAFSCDNKIVKIDLQVVSTTVLKTGPCDDSLFNSVLAWSPDWTAHRISRRRGWELPTKLWIMQSDGNEIHYQLAHFDAQCQCGSTPPTRPPYPDRQADRSLFLLDPYRIGMMEIKGVCLAQGRRSGFC